MKIIDIANKIDKSKENQSWVDINELGEELNVELDYYGDQDRIKCYWVGNWCCTDSWVGYRMYFFDDKPFAYSTQTGRKSSEVFYWFSREFAEKVREYLLTLIVEDNEFDINLCDINEDVGDGYKIHFSEQIINKNRIMFNGEKVEILERIKNKPYGIDTELKIKLPNGEEKHVEIEELDFGYHVV